MAEMVKPIPLTPEFRERMEIQAKGAVMGWGDDAYPLVDGRQDGGK